MFEQHLTEKCVFLPLSGNRYSVTLDGVVRAKSGCVVPITVGSGGGCVKLDWYDGYREYSLALVMAFSFKPVKLPLVYWKELRVLFADGNSQNIHPANLVWKFPVALGADDHNGFAYIPMYSRYAINSEGVVYDTFMRRTLSPQANRRYMSYTLKTDMGHFTTLKRHRGMCLAFTDYPHNVDTLQVNHINGIAGDDRLVNLEWMTPSENRKHAVDTGLTRVCKAVTVEDMGTGKVFEFQSIAKMLLEMPDIPDRPKWLISEDGRSAVAGKYLVKYINPDHVYGLMQNLAPVLAKNLRTGIVEEFCSIAECSKKLGITKRYISTRIDTPGLVIAPDGFVVKRKDDLTPWPDLCCRDFDKFSEKWNTGVLVRNCLTGVVDEFQTQRAACEYLSIAEATITVWLKEAPGTIFKSGTGILVQIKKKTDTSEWLVYDDPEEEYLSKSLCKKVLVRNSITGEIQSFDSALACAKQLGLLTTTLNWRLKSKGQKTYPDGFQFKYATEKLEFINAEIPF